MTKQLIALLIALPLLILAKGAQAIQQSTVSSANEAAWTADDIISSEQASGFQVSPDGRWAVWVKSSADKEKNSRVSNLILSSLTEKKEIELTRGSESSFNPRWSPDGQLIAFISARQSSTDKPPADGPRPQIWLINPFGGEPWAVTQSSRAVSGYEWVDSENIVFIAQEEPTRYESQLKEKKDTSIVVEDEQHAPPVRLFQLSVKSKKVSRLSDNTDRIQSIAVSPDGRYAAAIHDRSLRYVYDNQVKPVAFLHDLKNGGVKQILTDPKLNISSLSWARDSKGFYAVNNFTSHPQYVNATIAQLLYYDPASDATVKVNLEWENGLAGNPEVTEEGFIALLAGGARHKAARYIRQGSTWRREWLNGSHAQNIFGLKIGKDNKTVLYAYSTASSPTQWFRSRLEGSTIDSAAQLTDLNAKFKKKVIAKTEVVRWKGALDEEVEGILFYPHKYEAGKRYPLVVMIHGGPAGADFDAWSDSWAYPHNLMCQRGAFILKPNYHGSSNYGLKWVESIAGGKYYELEVPDIEKGVDSLITRGLVDPAKLGVMGWSNGSILTIALTITTTRYKVASAGAGDVEWTSDWGNAHFGAAFDNYYFGKSPLEDPDLYVRKSPFYRLDRVRTPTIIFFGTEDTNVPTQQGWLHYRALQQLGKTDVRFILFPGEKHSPQKLAHQQRKVEEEMVWFDKYLFQTAKDQDEALHPESPLAQILKLKSAKQDRGRYGAIEHGQLIPETVKRNGLEIGRFEITRAQYAQFDKSYKVEVGKENYPANNISFDRARDYCEWLSKLTGANYRLAAENEVEAIYSSPAKSENTLDYWAGYAVNPDDAARLQSKIAGLKDSGGLLKEVGSFKGAGEDPLFDIGGNVAEWVIAKDGAGRALGASADTTADPRSRSRKAAPDYIGFRVVKGRVLVQ